MLRPLNTTRVSTENIHSKIFEIFEVSKIFEKFERNPRKYCFRSSSKTKIFEIFSKSFRKFSIIFRNFFENFWKSHKKSNLFDILSNFQRKFEISFKFWRHKSRVKNIALEIWDWLALEFSKSVQKQGSYGHFKFAHTLREFVTYLGCNVISSCPKCSH